ncbi:MAG: hypothetical protein RIS94_3252 [Pseudomonadota bacterium]
MRDQSLQPPAGRIVALDGLRGIAAIIVLMLHFDDLSGASGVFGHGYMAVDFFFMLSGFVLVPQIEGPRAAPAGRLMLQRLSRLWPLMALGVLIGAATHAAAWGAPAVLPLIPLALLYLPRLDGTLMTFPLNQPQWSLQIELAANVAHLLLLRHVRTPVLLVLSALCWVVLLKASLDTGSLQVGSNGQDWLYGFVRAGFAYSLGIALGRNRLARRDLAWWIAPVLLVATLLLPAIPGVNDALVDPLSLLAFPAVIAAGASANVPAQVAPRLTWLGAISFPLYATHFPILEAAHVLADDLPVVVRAPVFLGALGLCVWIAHWLARSPLARGFRLPSLRRPQARSAG